MPAAWLSLQVRSRECVAGDLEGTTHEAIRIGEDGSHDLPDVLHRDHLAGLIRPNRGHQKALTQCLRRLEASGFIKRSVVSTAPVAVV